MEINKKQISLITCIILGVTLLFKLSVIPYMFTSFSGVLQLIDFLSKIALIVFIAKDDRKLAAIPFGAMVVVDLVCIIMHFSLSNILYFVMDSGFVVMLLSETILSDKIDSEMFKKFWFVPAAIYFLGFIIGAFGYGIWYFFGNIILCLLNVLAYLAIGIWAMDIDVSKFEVSQKENGTNSAVEYAPLADGYCDLLKHILLLLFTFGIWQYIWIYRTTSYLNNTPGEEHRNPATKLLLCMFVPLYYIYWIYKSAQRIDKLAISKGQPSDIATLCLILSILVGIVPPILMQEKINNIVKPKADVNTAVNVETAPKSNAGAASVGVADEIKKYKELLDSGIITEEEFESKKKQLLDL